MTQVPVGQITTLISTSVDSTSGNSPPSATPITLTYPDSVTKLDIEHALVEDDPRLWSNIRKSVILLTISAAAMTAGLSNNIQNPANAQIQQDLHATASQISLTLSLFIVVQGNFPLVWTAISEIKGRKLVYLVSFTLFTVGSVILAISKNIGLVIGMRVMQAAGSSAALAVGAATLADMYEPHQRGSMMGVYYSAPLLGPAIGSVIGGALAQALTWRAIFWFLAILGGVVLSAFLLVFRDTFRKERSSVYQNIVKRRVQEGIAREDNDEKKTLDGGPPRVQTPKRDVEAQPGTTLGPAVKEVKVSFADINPFPPYLQILRRKNNVAVLIPSAIIFAFSFCIAYTCSRTLSVYYNYDAMKIGLVLLAFGIGGVLGSIFGGRWSDRTLARLKAANNDVSYPEMRLESAKVVMLWFPPAIVGYAWVCQQHVHVSAICVMLFLCGFFLTWIYASTLAYIVDANVGRSSSAVATNSSFRGTLAFVTLEVAIPLQDAIGDRGLYTLWAGLMLLAELLILLVIYKGKRWREARVDAERRKYGS